MQYKKAAASRSLEQVMRKVLAKITPSEAERKKLLSIAKDIEVKVSAAYEELGVEAIVRLEGSLAKDTWLREDPDVDVFMRLPTTIPRKSLGEIALRVAKAATEGAKQVERFAEHPYLEAFMDGVRVNIVPCYDAKPGEWLSATDRTPYHTDFINEHLKKSQRTEVRLLKRYMKGIGVYGAEIKIGGFSGYLCELLVLHYGSFAKVLESFSDNAARRAVDMQDYYKDRQKELALLFPEPLVVVDPVDRARNVASAVQPPRLHTFIAANRVFLSEPNEEFFYPLKTQALTPEELHKAIECRGSSLVLLSLGRVEAVPDVLWGQLHRTRKSLRKQFEIGGFTVLRDDVWSEEDASFIMFLFELEQNVLSRTVKHAGPPLEFKEECENFLAKYTCNCEVVSGPLIDEGRWVVEVPRKFANASEMLKERLASGGSDMGVAELITKALREGFFVLIGNEITKSYTQNSGFAAFLTDFLSGRPFWLGAKWDSKSKAT